MIWPELSCPLKQHFGQHWHKLFLPYLPSTPLIFPCGEMMWKWGMATIACPREKCGFGSPTGGPPAVIGAHPKDTGAQG